VIGQSRKMIPLSLMIATTLLLLTTSFAAAAQKTIVVTWNYEAPDMSDDREFNESGTRTVPLQMDKTCKEFDGSLRLHAFQYIAANPNGQKARPLVEPVAGVTIGVTRVSDERIPRLCVAIESGRGTDTCCGWDRFTIPRLSSSEWSSMPRDASWVFQKEGVALPKLWSRVFVKCE
jgi:hypothetical protein